MVTFSFLCLLLMSIYTFITFQPAIRYMTTVFHHTIDFTVCKSCTGLPPENRSSNDRMIFNVTLISRSLPLFVCICSGYGIIVCVCAGHLSCNYGLSPWRLLVLSAWRLKTLCSVCGLPGAMYSIIHTGCVYCLCILCQQSISMLSPTVHSTLCMDSERRAVFHLL